jgi:hypothetical protein
MQQFQNRELMNSKRDIVTSLIDDIVLSDDKKKDTIYKLIRNAVENKDNKALTVFKRFKEKLVEHKQKELEKTIAQSELSVQPRNSQLRNNNYLLDAIKYKRFNFARPSRGASSIILKTPKKSNQICAGFDFINMQKIYIEEVSIGKTHVEKKE